MYFINIIFIVHMYVLTKYLPIVYIIMNSYKIIVCFIITLNGFYS